MADRRISQLSEVSSSVVSDVLPIVSSGVTSKITVGNIRTAIISPGTISSSNQLPNGIISSSIQIDRDLFNIDNLISSSAQISSDISGAFTSTSASLASDIAGITTFTTDGTGILSSSAQIASNISGAFNDSHLATTGSNTFKGNQTISGSLVLRLQPSHPLPSSATVGSFAVTGSDVAFYDGANWKRIVTGSF